jgi:putative membrane protein
MMCSLDAVISCGVSESPAPAWNGRREPRSQNARIRFSSPLRYVAASLAIAASLPAFAHVSDARAREYGDLSWSFEPWVLTCLLLSAALYALGVARLWRHAGRGRGVNMRQMSAFSAGWLVLVIALTSPLDQLGSELFSAHMVQHELLMIVAAPLLVLGRPLGVWAWALPFRWRRAVGRFLHRRGWRAPWLLVTSPVVAWLLHALALWLWHMPALFDAALANDGVHTLQHSAFLLTALLFWWSVLGAATRSEQGIALVSIFTTMVHTGALGALLTLSKTPWYSGYFTTASIYGLNALEDQELGGLIMWVPAGLVYIICGLALASRWMRIGPIVKGSSGVTAARLRAGGQQQQT